MPIVITAGSCVVVVGYRWSGSVVVAIVRFEWSESLSMTQGVVSALWNEPSSSLVDNAGAESNCWRWRRTRMGIGE